MSPFQDLRNIYWGEEGAWVGGQGKLGLIEKLLKFKMKI